MIEPRRIADAPCGKWHECSGASAAAMLVHSGGCGRPRPLWSALEEPTNLAVLRSPDPDRARRRGRASGGDRRPRARDRARWRRLVGCARPVGPAEALVRERDATGGEPVMAPTSGGCLARA